MSRRLTLDGSANPLDEVRESIVDRWTGRAKLVLAAIGSASLGAAIGLAVTYGVVTDDTTIGASRLGPWRYWLDAGRTDMNPYLRARFAVNAQIPLASGEGLSVFARDDDAGNPLRRRCSYRIGGAMPDALFWTIGVTNEAGMPIDNPAGRTAFSAADILRDGAGQFTIAISPRARPGNWLPLLGEGSFVLVLRLYGAQPAAGGAKSDRDFTLPSISLERCK